MYVPKVGAGRFGAGFTCAIAALIALLTCNGCPAENRIGGGEGWRDDDGGDDDEPLGDDCPYSEQECRSFAESHWEQGANAQGVFASYFSVIIDWSRALRVMEDELGLALEQTLRAAGAEFDVNDSAEERFVILAERIDQGFGAQLEGPLLLLGPGALCELETAVLKDAVFACEHPAGAAIVQIRCEGECITPRLATDVCEGELLCEGRARRFSCYDECQGECELRTALPCEGECLGECHVTRASDCDGVFVAEGEQARVMAPPSTPEEIVEGVPSERPQSSEPSLSTKAGPGRCYVRGGAMCEGVCDGTCKPTLPGRCDGLCKGQCAGQFDASNCQGKRICRSPAGEASVCEGSCRGRLQPHSISAECEETVRARAQLQARCFAPDLRPVYQFSGSLMPSAARRRAAESQIAAFAKAYARLAAKQAEFDGLLETGAWLAATARGALKAYVSVLLDNAPWGPAATAERQRLECSFQQLYTVAEFIAAALDEAAPYYAGTAPAIAEQLGR